MPYLSLVIPVYNEEENLPLLFDAVMKTMKSLKKTWEVIFVDDGSRDKSLEVLRNLAEQDRHVRVVVFRRNFGQTAAISGGIDYAKGEVIILMDADLQNDPADIPMLLSKLDEGYDVVSGWRKDRKDNLTRTLPSVMANGLISWVTGVHLHDYGCTSRLIAAKCWMNFISMGRRIVLFRSLPIRSVHALPSFLSITIRAFMERPNMVWSAP